jgi:hypothetical protein
MSKNYQYQKFVETDARNMHFLTNPPGLHFLRSSQICFKF